MEYASTRQNPHICAFLVVATVVAVVAMCFQTSACAQAVEPVGEYSSVVTGVDGFPEGFVVALWRDGDGYVGLFSYYNADARYRTTSLLKNVLLDDRGGLSFEVRVSLDFSREYEEAWTPRQEVLAFDGLLTESAVTGRIEPAYEADGPGRGFEPVVASLRRESTSDTRVYPSYGSWLAAHERRVGMFDTAVAAGFVPGENRARYYVGLLGGLSQALGDGSNQWKSGSHMGIDLLLPVGGHILLGGRFDYARFTPNVSVVTSNLIRSDVDGATTYAGGRSGVFTLAGVFRLTTGDFDAKQMVTFAQVTAGMSIVRMRAPIYIATSDERGLQSFVDYFGDDSTELAAGAGMGVSVAVSESSRLEVVADFRSTVSGSVELFDIAAQYRLAFRPR